MKQTCPKPPKERDTGGRGQSGSRGCDRGGWRGGRESNRAHLMVAEEEEEAGGDLTKEDQALVEAYSQGLRDRQKLMGDVKSVRDDASTSTGSRGNFVSFVHTATGTHDTLALVSIPTTRSPDWIVNSGASRHVTSTVGEFSSYTCLAVPESVHIADGMAQTVVGKGTVRCTDSVTLTNVLHAPSFPVNLVSISAIIREQKCIVTFDIPRMVFQEKGTGRILGTGTWRDGLWYMDRKGMDTALASVVDRVGAGGSGVSVEDELLLIHRRMGHSSFSLLERLYPSEYEKADKHKLVYDGCEFGNHTRSSYVSSGSRSSHVFDLVHSDVWGPCPTITVNGSDILSPLSIVFLVRLGFI